MLAYYDENGRVCTMCAVYKPWDAYHTQPRGQNGKKARCALCSVAVTKQNRNKHLELNREKDAAAKRAKRASDPTMRAREATAHKAWHAKNPEYREAYNKRYYQENTEKVKAGVRRYLSTHVEEAKAWQQNYRARRKSAGKLTGAMVRRVLTDKVCFYCEKPFMLTRKARQPTLDHIIPLCQKGSNLEWNLVACCRSCNCRKKHRNLAQWTPDIGRVRIAEKMATRLAALGVIEVDSS